MCLVTVARALRSMQSCKKNFSAEKSILPRVQVLALVVQVLRLQPIPTIDGWNHLHFVNRQMGSWGFIWGELTTIRPPILSIMFYKDLIWMSGTQQPKPKRMLVSGIKTGYLDYKLVEFCQKLLSSSLMSAFLVHVSLWVWVSLSGHASVFQKRVWWLAIGMCIL